MKKEPLLRNENPEEIREIVFNSITKIKENENDKEIHKDVLFELGLIEGRIDQKKLKELITKGIENLKENKITTSLHYLNMALAKLGHIFSEDEEIDNLADMHLNSTTEDPLK